MSAHSGSATLPRDFRYHDCDSPRTPEPCAGDEEAVVPSPPPPRLKLKKRRVVSHLCAPTQQFLASVAAADVPIPSIEEPEIVSLDSDMIDPFSGMDHHTQDDEDMTLSLDFRGRALSPPKTPAPGVLPPLSPTRYPNWSLDDSAFSSCESSPDPDDLSRPSTSRSTETSSSLFSHFSQLSGDLSCASPDTEPVDKFLTVPSRDDGPSKVVAGSKAKPRKAPWTKAMSAHLWSTYMLYLQDPRVTPVRMGKSCLPPHGVCLRVAREAKRSWRGTKASSSKSSKTSDKSGSNTPTAESSGAFIQWPHTSAATRAHLRELCKLKAVASSGPRGARYVSRSPTPFNHAAQRRWNRRSTPGPTPSMFTTQEMAVSLTVSTSDAMHPQGPLAQLTGSSVLETPILGIPSHVRPPENQALSSENESSVAVRRRLGSPFSARSYGPSSTSSLAAALGLTGSHLHRKSRSIGPRRTLNSLNSSARLSRSSTQKRRTRQSSSREPRKRLSLASDFWTEPGTSSSNGQPLTRPETAYSSTRTQPHDELFVPRTPAESLLEPPTLPVTAHLAPPSGPPPRLGSPFSVSGTSFSFPGRVAQPADPDIGGLSRPFSTVQQPPATSRISQARANLASRLAYIDQRLKEFNNRTIHRRSRSPL